MVMGAELCGVIVCDDSGHSLPAALAGHYGRCTINAREVKRLVAQGEGPLLEFKPGDERPLSLATTLAALANAEGGTLVVGVTERMIDGHVASVIEGVTDPKRALDHLYTAAGLCDPKMDLLPPERVVVDRRTVLVVTIPEGMADAYSVEGRFQARGGSFRRTLGADEIRSLLNQRGRYAYDATAVPGARRDDLDDALVAAYVSRFRSGVRMDPDTLLAARGLVTRAADDAGAPPVPTVAGILLLGRQPQQFLPQARVAVVRYAGPSMGERFLAREIEGPLAAQLDAAEAWVATTMLHGVELKGLGRTDIDEYPLEAVRELILNALAHRDWVTRGDRVRLYMFSDRLEIVSPGTLGGPMRLDTLGSHRWSRNASLVQGLVALGVMEELGFGLRRVAEALADAGLPPAEFRQTESTFVVTLRGHGAALLAARPPTQTVEQEEERPRQRRSVVERHAWVLDHLRTVGAISTRTYAEAMGISLDTALNDLTALARRGLVEARGTTRDRRWFLRPELPVS